MNQEPLSERAPEPGPEPTLTPAIPPPAREGELEEPRWGQAPAPELLGRAIFD